MVQTSQSSLLQNAMISQATVKCYRCKRGIIANIATTRTIVQLPVISVPPESLAPHPHPRVRTCILIALSCSTDALWTYIEIGWPKRAKKHVTFVQVIPLYPHQPLPNQPRHLVGTEHLTVPRWSIDARSLLLSTGWRKTVPSPATIVLGIHSHPVPRKLLPLLKIVGIKHRIVLPLCLVARKRQS